MEKIDDIRYVDLCISKKEIYICGNGYWKPYLSIRDFSGNEK
jgi:hypothetical protein